MIKIKSFAIQKFWVTILSKYESHWWGKKNTKRFTNKRYIYTTWILLQKKGIKHENANMKEEWWRGKFHLFEPTVFILGFRKSEASR